MKIAIMQPYIFPYIGYFQLLNIVDTFIFYDDVAFIKQGWINRNRILLNGKDYLFTIPIEKQSSYALIKNTHISNSLYANWRRKFLLTLEQSYKKAPYFNDVYKLVEDVLNSNSTSISELAQSSILNVIKYLGITKKIQISSEDYFESKGLSKEERLISICKKCNAKEYINPIGGQNLYKAESFLINNIDLLFIKSNPIEYKQFSNDNFISWLSIIDILMFNSSNEIKKILNQCELILPQ